MTEFTETEMKGICIFYNTEAGCKRGDSCWFQHIKSDVSDCPRCKHQTRNDINEKVIKKQQSCAYCNGVGKITENDIVNQICNECRGTGTQLTETKINSNQKQVPTSACPSCGGKGSLHKTIMKLQSCHHCQGVGSITKEEIITGTLPFCYLCQGTGYILTKGKMDLNAKQVSTFRWEYTGDAICDNNMWFPLSYEESEQIESDLVIQSKKKTVLNAHTEARKCDNNAYEIIAKRTLRRNEVFEGKILSVNKAGKFGFVESNFPTDENLGIPFSFVDCQFNADASTLKEGDILQYEIKSELQHYAAYNIKKLMHHTSYPHMHHTTATEDVDDFFMLRVSGIPRNATFHDTVSTFIDQGYKPYNRLILRKDNDGTQYTILQVRNMETKYKAFTKGIKYESNIKLKVNDLNLNRYDDNEIKMSVFATMVSAIEDIEWCIRLMEYRNKLDYLMQHPITFFIDILYKYYYKIALFLLILAVYKFIIISLIPLLCIMTIPIAIVMYIMKYFLTNQWIAKSYSYFFFVDLRNKLNIYNLDSKTNIYDIGEGTTREILDSCPFNTCFTESKWDENTERAAWHIGSKIQIWKGDWFEGTIIDIKSEGGNGEWLVIEYIYGKQTESRRDSTYIRPYDSISLKTVANTFYDCLNNINGTFRMTLNKKNGSMMIQLQNDEEKWKIECDVDEYLSWINQWYKYFKRDCCKFDLNKYLN